MQITLETRNYPGIETEAIVSYLFEETDPVQGQLDEIDRGAGGLLRKLVKGGEVSGKMLEFTLIHSPQGLKASRLLLIGAGKREQFNGAAGRNENAPPLRYLKERPIK